MCFQQDRYNEIIKHFPEEAMQVKEISVDENKRTVVVTRQEKVDTVDPQGNVIQRVITYYKYIHIDNGDGLTEKEIEKKFSHLGKKVGEETYYPDQNGKLVLV
jgi:hypothetical protein